MNETRKLRIFLSYAHADVILVNKLYKDLTANGFDVWFDEENLIPGQDWQSEIEKALYNSDCVIVCLSPVSVSKEGFVQKEFKFAIDKSLEMTEGGIFLIPVRLNECQVPSRLNKYHWVDLFANKGFDRLMKALKLRSHQIFAASSSDPSQQLKNNLEVEFPIVPRPYNLGFDGSTIKGVPVGWFNSLFYVDNVSIDYEISVVQRDNKKENGTCVLLQKLNARKDQFGSLMQRCPADFLAGKMIKLEGEIQTKDVKDWSGLWLRVDGIEGFTLFFDNMYHRPIRGTTSWKKYKIEAQLPKETIWLNYGIVLSGSGMIWADDFRLMVWENNSWKDV